MSVRRRTTCMPGEHAAPRLGAVILPLLAAGLWCDPALAAWQKFTGAQSPGEGLVLCVVEDRGENLWFGTQGNGVSRFDGVRWQTWTTAQGLAGNTVTAVLQDRHGHFWFGTGFDGVTPAGGVSRYDGTSWTTFTAPGQLTSNEVTAILEDRHGRLWFGTDRGLTCYDGSAWNHVQHADPRVNRVAAILEDRAGAVWVGTANGVFRVEGGNWTPAGLPDQAVDCILEDRSGNLWFGTSGWGATRRDTAGTWTPFTTAQGLGGDHVHSMVEDRRGRIWFATNREFVSRYDGFSIRTIANPIYGGFVIAMAQDRSGNLWFGGSLDGVYRYDDSAWTTFTTADGLAHDGVWSLLEDHEGSLWFGCEYVGATRYDGATWTTITPDSGLGGDLVRAMIQDRAGNIWFTFWLYGQGVSRFDGAGWTTFTAGDGLADDRSWSLMEDRSGRIWVGTLSGASVFDGAGWSPGPGPLASGTVYCMLEDRTGRLWFGTDNGACVQDGPNWRCFTAADGLAGTTVAAMLEDRSGNLWFGTSGGVTRYDGATWTTFTRTNGLPIGGIAMLEDRSGVLWFTGTGVSRFDGSEWRTLNSTQGLAHDRVFCVLEDRSGALWFGTQGGASRYEPDRVPPRSVFLVPPPTVSASRNQSAVFGAAFGEVQDVEFSHRFDGGAWSAWSPQSAWVLNDVPDGIHTLEVRARDYLGTVDSSAAVAMLEVDATPPAPVIASPAFGAPVRGRVAIRGTATDARFREYRLEAGPAGAAAALIVRSAAPVADGLLATWDTSSLPDGNYELHLSVTDTLGLTGIAQVTVIVDNLAPFADVTAPARVVAATGGDIYTTNAELHVYFPPRAFREDAVVSVAALPTDSVPAVLPSGGQRVLPGYEVGWGEAALEKPARLELSYAGLEPAPEPEGLALHHSTDGVSWRRLGGTVDAGTQRISLAVSEPGRYALFAGGTGPAGERTLSALTFTPRVFSPTGGFADREVGIAFTLGQASSVTVRVYSRAGWLVREVVSGQAMNPGANLVRWDGRDRDGAVVTDGLYLVTVEALGQRQSKALAVVR